MAEEEWWHRAERAEMERRRQGETDDDARLWAQFMAAEMSAGRQYFRSGEPRTIAAFAETADAALSEYRKRYPRTTEPK